MRALLYFNLIVIVTIAGALAQMYEGVALPWGKNAVLADYFKAAPDAKIQRPVPALKAPAPLTGSGQAETEPVAPVAKTKLRVLTEGAYPPFNGRDSSGALVGFDIDMANEICARLKRACVIEARPWKSLLISLKRDEGDMVVASMLIPTEGSSGVKAGKQIAFSKSYYRTPGHFAARRDGKALGLSAGSLATQTIAVQAGSTHEAFLKARFADATLLSLPSLDEAEAAVIDRRADLVFADRNALLNWMKRGGGDGCCRMVGGDYDDPIFFGQGAGIALRSKDKELRADVDGVLAAIAQDGTALRLARPYFGQAIR
ncbi:MAG: transporter substrate-binding domain-containing protein [Parvibaculum sp.]|nr:transporter substrate-binding domain-containing protein [Parvibaculum sp.]